MADEDDPTRFTPADASLLARRFLLDYFRQLKPDALWLLFDGLILGNLTTTQLGMLVEAVRQREADARARPRRVGRGRPPAAHLLIGAERIGGFDHISDAAIRGAWRTASVQLTAFGKDRTQYRAPMNRTRSGAPRDKTIRARCLASAIGQRVHAAGLFEEFFDAGTTIPSEMAAQLVLGELRQQFEGLAQTHRTDAEMSPSPETREWAAAEAEKVVGILDNWPDWRTFYQKLRTWRPQPKRT